MAEQKDNSGAIFKNDYKTEDKHPDYKGTCMIDGKQKEIGVWLNETQQGKKYFSLKFSEPHAKQGESVQKPKDTDSIPF